MTAAKAVTRESLTAIAYHALWELRDLDPMGEPSYVKRTRLDLHQQLDGRIEAEAPAEVRHLHLVTESETHR